DGLVSGRIAVQARDLTEPSPLALEVLSARPYAYLDDAPLEERRTQAVMSRRWLDPQSAADIGKLDPEAIARVKTEAWPDAATPDELHDAISWMTFLAREEIERDERWPALVRTLIDQRRALAFTPSRQSSELIVAAERTAMFNAIFPDAALESAVPDASQPMSREEALVEVVRGRLEALGPTTAQAIADALGVPVDDIDAALLALEAEGSAMRGRFSDATSSTTEWCNRRLLARIHRYTVKRL